MSGYNLVVLLGNLTRDPVLKYLPSGDAVCNYDIAVNTKFKNQTGEIQEDVLYQKCVSWKRLAENIAEYCSSGSQVLAEGTLKNNKWKNDAGEDRMTTVATITKIKFLGKKKNDQS